MEQQTIHTTFRSKRKPTPVQERALETALWRCRTLENGALVALEDRKMAWDRCHVSVTSYQQKAELPDLKAACPAYAAVQSPVVQDVLLRWDRAFQAFFRRVKAGEQPGYPVSRGAIATTASP